MTDLKCKNDLRAFTLMEIMMVIIILGMLAAYAIPNYRKAVRKGYEKQMIQTAYAFFSANEQYRYQNKEGNYWATDPPSFPTTSDLSDINDGLNLHIIPTEAITYTHNYINGSTYLLLMTYKDGDPDAFTIELQRDNVNFTKLSTTQPNPCCKVDSDCPTLDTCE